MTTEYRKPLPLPTDENKPFLDGLKEKQVRLQRCAGCRSFRYPPAQFCPQCLSEDVEWAQVSGRGTIYSFIVVHQLYSAAFRDDLPYNVAIVQLEEGPRVTANVVGCANSDLRVGMPVTADYLEATPEATVLKFRTA